MKKHSRTGKLEWLETDGWGGFLCGVVNGTLSRKWHGWWHALSPPRKRIQLFYGISEQGSFRFDKEPALFSGPAERLDEVFGKFIWEDDEFLPLKSWKLEVNGETLKKALFQSPEYPGKIFIQYDAGKCSQLEKLSLRFYLPKLHKIKKGRENGFDFILNNEHAFEVYTDAPLSRDRHREKRQQLLFELEKDCEETDTYDVVETPLLNIVIPESGIVNLVLNYRPLKRERKRIRDKDFVTIRDKEIKRRQSLKLANLEEDIYADSFLAYSADQFLVRDVNSKYTVIAGYPWFADWGRDTMISLPGLCLGTGKVEVGKDIIRRYLGYLKNGLIPNMFPEDGVPPLYNTADATLWLVEMMFRFFSHDEIKREPLLYKGLDDIITSYYKGESGEIYKDDDGFIVAGKKGTQLTWMDVKVDGHVPTPRHGKPIEIQALWYNALCWLIKYNLLLGEHEMVLMVSDYTRKLEDDFVQTYLEGECYLDVYDSEGNEEAGRQFRPNILIPFALTHNIIPLEKRSDILKRAKDELYISRAVRSLSSKDPSYKGTYRGDVKERDRAYHQGTGWGWLIWPFIKGLCEMDPDDRMIDDTLTTANRHLSSEGCFGHYNEIFDGDPPHQPRGCFAQAWSIASYIESLYTCKQLRGIHTLKNELNGKESKN